MLFSATTRVPATRAG